LVGLAQAYQRTGSFSKFQPYYLLQLEPLIWGLFASLIVGVLVSFITQPPEERLVSKLFDAEPQTA
jgi:hypothetical protein